MHTAITTMRRRARRLSLATLAMTALLVLGVAAFNWLVDPYAFFATPRWTGFNAIKNRLHKNERLVKAVHVVDRKPTTVILGTSRTAYGIDPRHPALASDPTTYNLALSGANIYEIHRCFQHVQGIGPVHLALVGLDFFSFNAYSKGGLGPLDRDLAITPDGQRRGWTGIARLRYAGLPSLDMLGIAWATVTRQRGNREMILPDGQLTDAEIINDIRDSGGNRPAFEQNVRTYYGFGYLPRPERAFSFEYPARRGQPPPAQPATTFDPFRALVREAYASQVDLRLFISPSHAWQWEIIDAASLTPRFEEWKRTLVAIVLEEAQRAGQPPFPLWDFADYSPPTCEDVPPIGDTRLMANYWESSHYRKELGNQVLDRILADRLPAGTSPAPTEFGILLTEGNLEAHLATIRQRAAAYRTTHPEDAARVRAIWNEEASAEGRGP